MNETVKSPSVGQERTFMIRVLTPEDEIFSGAVRAVSLTAALGKLSILYQHAPFITTLSEGAILLDKGSTNTNSVQKEEIPLHSGFMMVKGNTVTILKSA